MNYDLCLSTLWLEAQGTMVRQSALQHFIALDRTSTLQKTPLRPICTTRVWDREIATRPALIPEKCLPLICRKLPRILGIQHVSVASRPMPSHCLRITGYPLQPTWDTSIRDEPPGAAECMLECMSQLLGLIISHIKSPPAYHLYGLKLMCSAGTYQAQYGQTQCTTCPRGALSHLPA